MEGLCDRGRAPSSTSMSLQSAARLFQAFASTHGVHITEEQFNEFCQEAQKELTEMWTGQTEDQLRLEQLWLEYLKAQGWHQQQWLSQRLTNVREEAKALEASRDERARATPEVQRRHAQKKEEFAQKRLDRQLDLQVKKMQFDDELEDARLSELQNAERADATLQVKHMTQRRSNARKLQEDKFDQMTANIAAFERLVLDEAMVQFLGKAKRNDGKALDESTWSEELTELKAARVEALVSEVIGELKASEANSVLATQETKLAALKKMSQAHDKGLEIKKKEREMKTKENALQREQKACKNAEKLKNDAELLNQHVHASTAMSDMEKSIETGLKITPKDMEEAAAAAKKVQYARIMWLGVIVGCELDLYGFLLGSNEYWAAGSNSHPTTNIVMRIMLVVGPIGYLLATAMYIYMTQCYEPDYDVEAQKGLRERLVDQQSQFKVSIRDPYLMKILEGRQTAGGEAYDGVPYDRLVMEAERESVELKLYHMLPIIRYYLLVKDPQSNDVESLFRVNALSTFSLGFAQIFCAMLGIANGTLQWDVKLQVGALAQVVNFSMTWLYFFTTYPAMMKAQMQVEALQSWTSKLMQVEFVRYNLTVEQCSNRLGFDHPTEDTMSNLPADQRKSYEDVLKCRNKLIRDINLFGNCNPTLEEPLKQFSVTQLNDWRWKLASKNITAYGKLVA